MWGEVNVWGEVTRGIKKFQFDLLGYKDGLDNQDIINSANSNATDTCSSTVTDRTLVGALSPPLAKKFELLIFYFILGLIKL